MRLTKNRRFGSLGLNLAFEGVLLGVSLWLHMKGTCSDPHNSIFFWIHETLVYSKGAFVTFCRKLEVSEVSKRKQ
jgi:hypothetical protein